MYVLTWFFKNSFITSTRRSVNHNHSSETPVLFPGQDVVPGELVTMDRKIHVRQFTTQEAGRIRRAHLSDCNVSTLIICLNGLLGAAQRSKGYKTKTYPTGRTRCTHVYWPQCYSVRRGHGDRKRTHTPDRATHFTYYIFNPLVKIT